MAELAVHRTKYLLVFRYVHFMYKYLSSTSFSGLLPMSDIAIIIVVDIIFVVCFYFNVKSQNRFKSWTNEFQISFLHFHSTNEKKNILVELIDRRTIYLAVFRLFAFCVQIMSALALTFMFPGSIK